MFFAVLALLATFASGQAMSVGVKGGIPLGQTLEGQAVDPLGILGRCGECAASRTVPYLVGPSLEVPLTRQLSLSIDALYNRTNYHHTSGTLITPTSRSFNAEKHVVDRLEIPIMLRHSFKSWHTLRPFIAGGAALLQSQDTVQSRQYGSLDPPYAYVGPNETVPLSAPRSSTVWGPTFAVGARFGTGRIHPSIEYRYTHWTDPSTVVTPIDLSFLPIPGPATLRSRQNQSELIAGLMVDVTGADWTNDAAHLNRSRMGATLSRITVGVKGGLPLTQAFDVQPSGGFINPYFNKCGECATQRTVPYLIGPAIEVRIAGPYSVSAEALYSRADYNHTSSLFSVSGTSFLQDTKNTVDRWEFPVLLKFGAGGWRAIHPFLGLGATVQRAKSSTVQSLAGSHNLFGGTVIVRSNVITPPVRTVVVGPTVAVGARIGKRRLGPTVEFRYTRWFDAAIEVGPLNSAASVNGQVTVRSIQNQAQLLVGLMF